MAAELQYTKWQAQVANGQKLTGGSGDQYDVNVDAVPPDLVTSFIVSDVTNPSVAMYRISTGERWYRGGRTYTPVFPLQFRLKDGTLLTIERNSDAPGDLIYSQA